MPCACVVDIYESIMRTTKGLDLECDYEQGNRTVKTCFENAN